MFDTVDPLGRRIVLERDQWERHVLTESGRVEFQGHVGVAQNTIERPHMITRSGKVPDSDVYFRKGGHPEYPTLYVKIPVLFVGGVGYVSTVLLQKDTVQGTDTSKGAIRYVNWRS